MKITKTKTTITKCNERDYHGGVNKYEFSVLVEGASETINALCDMLNTIPTECGNMGITTFEDSEGVTLSIECHCEYIEVGTCKLEIKNNIKLAKELLKSNITYIQHVENITEKNNEWMRTRTQVEIEKLPASLRSEVIAYQANMVNQEEVQEEVQEVVQEVVIETTFEQKAIEEMDTPGFWENLKIETENLKAKLKDDEEKMKISVGEQIAPLKLTKKVTIKKVFDSKITDRRGNHIVTLRTMDDDTVKIQEYSYNRLSGTYTIDVDDALMFLNNSIKNPDKTVEVL